jgi:hypothetical protein
MEVLRNLKETREVWKMIEGESQRTLKKLETDIMKLRMVSTGEPEVKQIDIQVRVGKETITAVVDCGANVDYVNKEWCEKKGFPVTEIGQGWMEGYDGEQKRVKLQEAEIKFRFQGVFHRQKFRVIQATGTDILVLGMPWLQKHNPDIDWQKREVTLKKKSKASKETRRKNETPTGSREIAKKVDTRVEPTKGRRGGYDTTGMVKDKAEERSNEEDYQRRLQETRDKLPEELKDYAEVFCQKE